jgi:tetraacyldisaccharide 4'-kinase
MLKSFRYLFFPFSMLYAAILHVRHWLYDKGILGSASFNFPLICIGNLAMGGTGKTPMTEYVIRHLGSRYRTATISRGYKRRTKGFAIAGNDTTAIDIGDEPMQIHRKYPHVTVAVGEERLVAIPQLLQEKPDTQVIVLDDAFQHRAVKAGLNILLTDAADLYTRDHLLPTGDRRDVKSAAKRADVIVVTKCKSFLSVQEKQLIEEELAPAKDQIVLFAGLHYGQPYRLFSGEKKDITEGTDILLLCGIANPDSLKDYLKHKTNGYDMIRYRDHHIFTSEDLREIRQQFDEMTGAEKMILTTEKDAIRLEKFRSDLSDLPVYVLPVEHEFLFGGAEIFHKILDEFVLNYSRE